MVRYLKFFRDVMDLRAHLDLLDRKVIEVLMD